MVRIPRGSCGSSPMAIAIAAALRTWRWPSWPSRGATRSAAPRFAPPNRYVFGACGEGAEVGAQTPLAVHHAGTYPKQLRRAYSSSGPSCQLVGAKGRAAHISLPKGDV